MMTLLPLHVTRRTDPAVWAALRAVGPDVTVVVRLPHGVDADPRHASATDELARAGVRVLGHVDLGYAARPFAGIVHEVVTWAHHPVDGLFLDRAPTSPFCIGPVAQAMRIGRRHGLNLLVLNPGVPTDPLYRDLGAPICTYEGGWADYRRWSGHGSEPSDGHLVYGVPLAELRDARDLLGSRGAGFGLITDRGLPEPYGGLPAWCRGMAAVG